MDVSWNQIGAPLAVAGGALMVAFAVLWLRQCRVKNATLVDAAWAIAIGVLGVIAALTGDGGFGSRLLAGGLAGFWSVRLAYHLLRHRVLGSTQEDGRYRAMREHWGEQANRNFFWFYQLQAAVAWLFAMPFWFLAYSADASSGAGLTGLQWCGLPLAALAQIGEGIADRQLNAHRADPRAHGLACRRGLWRFSRHPNYFFEWLFWCGVGLVAAPAAGWWAVVQPVAMFLLVRFVSGVPFTELQALKSRGADYRRYQQETNAFVPWLPRRSEGTSP